MPHPGAAFGRRLVRHDGLIYWRLVRIARQMR
jgi:hypothetical protein